MNRRTAIPIALSAGLALATAPCGAPAHAADEIGLSSDGVVWHDALHQPLFDPDLRWVPGDAEIASFFVRNEGPTAARLTMELRDARGADVLNGDDVEITARAASGHWFQVEGGFASSSLTDRAIVRGGEVRVDVQVRFLWRAPNGSMLGRLPLDFTVRLVQAGSAHGDTGGDGSGALPDTGSPLTRLVVWLGAVLIGIGLALVAAARRRETEEVEIDA